MNPKFNPKSDSYVFKKKCTYVVMKKNYFLLRFVIIISYTQIRTMIYRSLHWLSTKKKNTIWIDNRRSSARCVPSCKYGNRNGRRLPSCAL